MCERSSITAKVQTAKYMVNFLNTPKHCREKLMLGFSLQLKFMKFIIIRIYIQLM